MNVRIWAILTHSGWPICLHVCSMKVTGRSRGESGLRLSRTPFSQIRDRTEKKQRRQLSFEISITDSSIRVATQKKDKENAQAISSAASTLQGKQGMFTQQKCFSTFPLSSRFCLLGSDDARWTSHSPTHPRGAESTANPASWKPTF